jgi:hypothetical protein
MIAGTVLRAAVIALLVLVARRVQKQEYVVPPEAMTEREREEARRRWQKGQRYSVLALNAVTFLILLSFFSLK